MRLSNDPRLLYWTLLIARHSRALLLEFSANIARRLRPPALFSVAFIKLVLGLAQEASADEQ